jgi:hypothetical protein
MWFNIFNPWAWLVAITPSQDLPEDDQPEESDVDQEEFAEE